jgi:hypothetical protein
MLAESGLSNEIAEAFCRIFNGSFCDSNNIVWKIDKQTGEWIGKRGVWTYDFRSCWLEDTVIANVKSWWCGGPDADYNEEFKLTN